MYFFGLPIIAFSDHVVLDYQSSRHKAKYADLGCCVLLESHPESFPKLSPHTADSVAC